MSVTPRREAQPPGDERRAVIAEHYKGITAVAIVCVFGLVVVTQGHRLTRLQAGTVVAEFNPI